MGSFRLEQLGLSKDEYEVRRVSQPWAFGCQPGPTPVRLCLSVLVVQPTLVGFMAEGSITFFGASRAEPRVGVLPCPHALHGLC